MFGALVVSGSSDINFKIFWVIDELVAAMILKLGKIVTLIILSVS